MTDEKYAYVSEVIEKKQTARSARNRRTHTGRGGKAKLPSDYMTKKELQAMNGECKTYRMNAPMKWAEFKAMPDKLKIDYIRSIKEKYDAPISAIADMFGIHRATLCQEFHRLGLDCGKPGPTRNYDKEGFMIWAYGTLFPKKEEEAVEEAQQAAPVVQESRQLAPRIGNMTFEGKLEDVMKTVSLLLGGEMVRITVAWEVQGE